MPGKVPKHWLLWWLFGPIRNQIPNLPQKIRCFFSGWTRWIKNLGIHLFNMEKAILTGRKPVPFEEPKLSKKIWVKMSFAAKLIHQTPHASILGKVIHMRHTFVIHMVCSKVLFVVFTRSPSLRLVNQGPPPYFSPWLVNHWFPLIRPLLNPYFPGFNTLGAGALPKTSARTFSAKVLMKKVHHHLTILRQDIRQWIRG